VAVTSPPLPSKAWLAAKAKPLSGRLRAPKQIPAASLKGEVVLVVVVVVKTKCIQEIQTVTKNMEIQVVRS
jgi:hypothetical protein